MTDGRSYDSVVGPARLFRGKNIKCYAVGIGRKFNRRQLLQIAGGDRRHVLTAGFRNLRSIAATIGRRACKGTNISNRKLSIFRHFKFNYLFSLAHTWENTYKLKLGKFIY